MQFGELLAVPLTFLIVLATAHLEDANLVVLAVRHHRGFDSRAGHQGRTNLELSAVADSQNLVDDDLLAYVRSNLFYFNFLASSNTILFATGFYDRVHVDLFESIPRGRISAEPNIVARSPSAGILPQGEDTPIPGASYNHPTPSPGSSPSFTVNAPQPTSPLALIADDMREVDKIIAQRLNSGVPLVGQVAQYIINAGGKRLRPALLLLTSGALGHAGTQRHLLAAVVEFIHTATLLHDDVVDDSTLRRGNATANETFGNPASVLVGDFLYSRAFQMMVETQSMRIMQVLADATNVIAEGEVQQLMNMHNADLDEDGYLQVIRSKTAKLFEASARCGAILAQASPALEEACAEYGQALGTAFQVIDDVLDYAGDASVMGKSLGDDLREGKATLPLIVAMQRGTAMERELIRSAIENGSVPELENVIGIVRRTGALEVSRQAAGREAERAISAARRLDAGPHAASLIQLASQLLGRQS